MDAKAILNSVIKPTLLILAEHEPRLNSDVAAALILGSGAHESHLGKYNMQVGGGPGRGFGQVEKATHTSLWQHHIRFRPTLVAAMNKISMMDNEGVYEGEDFHSQLIWNWRYNVAMMRLVYWMAKPPMPKITDLKGMALYWDLEYNKNPTKGHPEDFIRDWNKFGCNSIYPQSV